MGTMEKILSFVKLQLPTLPHTSPVLYPMWLTVASFA